MKVKKIKLTLVGIDGNAFTILSAFGKQARKENWTDEEIWAVLDKAQSSDYNNLLSTIMKHCK